MNDNLKAVSVKEIFTQPRISIEVPDNEKVFLNKEHKQYSQQLRKIAITTFKDLQLLKIVPEAIDEQDVLRAIELDDKATLDMARANFKITIKSKCSCHEGESDSNQTTAQQGFREFYNSIRKFSHFELAKLVSKTSNREIVWDSLEMQHLYRRIVNVGAIKTPSVYGLLLQDITIGENATLFVDPSVKLLLANDVRIYTKGRMIVTGSYIKINCKSVQGNLQRFHVVTDPTDLNN